MQLFWEVKDFPDVFRKKTEQVNDPRRKMNAAPVSFNGVGAGVNMPVADGELIVLHSDGLK